MRKAASWFPVQEHHFFNIDDFETVNRKFGSEVLTVHIHKESGEATCKWFDEKLDTKSGCPVLHHGKRAFHLTVNNPAGFNDEVVFANILAGVRMTLDKDNDCWLLNSTDNAYVERQKERYSKYHNSTPKLCLSNKPGMGNGRKMCAKIMTSRSLKCVYS